MSTAVARTAAAIAAVRADEAAEGTRRFLDLPLFRDGIRLRTRLIDDVLREAHENAWDARMGVAEVP